MKRTCLILLLGIFVLTACGTPAPTAIPEIPPTATVIPLPSATPSLTVVPTKTTIPVTATLDLANLPTLTPQAPAVCPEINPKARFQVASLFKNKKEAYHDVRQATLDFLNSGGDPQIVAQKLGENGVSVRLMDLTHDGVQELLIESGYLTILGCANGQFTTLLDMAPKGYGDWLAIPLAIQDLNKNGMPEILIAQADKFYDWGGVQPFLQFANYTILEWDGDRFAPLIDDVYDSKHGSISVRQGILKTAGHSRASTSSINGNWSIEDLDNNGLKDIIVLAGIDNANDPSQLEEKVVLKWDGKRYRVSETGLEATPIPTPTNTPHPFSATCDFKAPELRYSPPSTTIPGAIQTAIEDFLNAGGAPEQLKAYYGTTIRDLNNDKLPDVLVISNNYNLMSPQIYLFTCNKGTYQNSLNYNDSSGADFYAEIMTIKDLNQNKLPEIVIRIAGCPNLPCGSIYIFEWNGEDFASLVKENGTTLSYAAMDHPTDVYLEDINNDKIPELIWKGGMPTSNMSEYYFDGPWRLETHIYQWDGKNYVAQPIKYSDPIYRFQAVQDADREAALGDYANALNLYNKTIFSDGLDWWSPEKSKYLPEKLSNEAAQSGKIVPTPIPDTTERPKLSAYAYFREMLVYLLTGKPEEAQKNHETLLRNYVGDNPGAPYTEMATAFWTEYQKAQNMSNACKAATDYASQHPEILAPLGSDYHGLQSHTYTVADVCPFK